MCLHRLCFQTRNAILGRTTASQRARARVSSASDLNLTRGPRRIRTNTVSFPVCHRLFRISKNDGVQRSDFCLSCQNLIDLRHFFLLRWQDNEVLFINLSRFTPHWTSKHLRICLQRAIFVVLVRLGVVEVILVRHITAGIALGGSQLD